MSCLLNIPQTVNSVIYNNVNLIFYIDIHPLQISHCIYAHSHEIHTALNQCNFDLCFLTTNFIAKEGEMPAGICLCYSISKAQEFEWESQLKFYWWKPVDNLVVRQCTGTCCKI